MALVAASPLLANEAMFRQWDKNGDGFLSRREVPEGPRQIFDKKDTNGDGKVSLEEHLDRGKPSRGHPDPSKGRPTAPGDATFSITQSWSQEPDGFGRPVYVAEPREKARSTPVVIFFHGNGGEASRSLSQWTRIFPKHLVVAPQGYRRSWNIQGEASLAPDVSFFRSLVREIGERYPYVDRQDVSLIGSSNGGAMIYRLLIEIEEELFQTAVPMVSSLLEAQYHDGNFWKSRNESDTAELGVRVNPPRNEKLRILYLHGTEDRTVPFDGGLRFGKYRHLSAYRTAEILSRHLGYEGAEQTRADGRDVGQGLILHRYEGTGVHFVAVSGGSHGLQPHREAAIELVRKFIENER